MAKINGGQASRRRTFFASQHGANNNSCSTSDVEDVKKTVGSNNADGEDVDEFIFQDEEPIVSER